MLKVLFKNLAICGALTFFLSSCGFQPLLSGQHTEPQRFVIKLNGSGYSAYKLRRELEKQLALTPKINDKAYLISLSMSEGYVPIAYGTDATISRNQIQATTKYTIEEGSQFIAAGTVTSYSTYMLNYTQEFNTRSAESAASERTLINLAEELAREIMLKIRSLPEERPREKLEMEVSAE